MKKILTVSLFAMMAVSAANADIASTDYVGKQITATAGTLTTLKTTAKGNLVAAINEVDDNIGTVSFTADGATKGKTNLTEAIAAVDAQVQGMSNTLVQDITGDINELAGTVSGMDEAYKAADAALDGRLTTAEGNITSLQSNKANTEYVNTELNKKQNNLSQTQMDAVNSTITSEKVTKYEAYDAKITAAKKAGDDAQADVDALETTVSDMDTAYKLADTNIKNTIGTVPADKTVVGMIAEAQTAATYDDTAVRGLISDNADEINTIKSSAYATSGITKAKVDTYDGYDAKITAAKKAGDDAQADVDALKTTVSDMDTAYKLADTNIKNTIGDVASDKTVVGMIADAKSGAVTEAANDAKTKYQVKSSAAYTIGTTGGGWTDLKSLTGYSKTGTFSLVLKNDVLQWEAVNY